MASGMLHCIAAGFAAFAFAIAVTGQTAAQEAGAGYPSRNVTFVIPFPAGGVPDIVARIISPPLSELLGKPVVVENRPGASTTLATTSVVRATPDGYTILSVDISYTVAPNLVVKSNYDPLSDLTPVVLTSRSSLFLAVNPALPANSPQELVALAKAKPGELKYGTSGIGTPPHLGAVSFLNATGVSMLHVPYRGAALALQDVVGGHIQLIFTAPSVAASQGKAGQVRVLGVTGAQRSSSLPEVPTFKESGINMKEFDFGTWFGVMVPNGTPDGIVTKLNAAINKVLVMPDVVEKLAKQDFSVAGGAPSELTKVVELQTKYWREALQAAGVKPE